MVSRCSSTAASRSSTVAVSSTRAPLAFSNVRAHRRDPLRQLQASDFPSVPHELPHVVRRGAGVNAGS